MSVKPIKVEIDEIQHADPAEIAKAKARAAYTATGQPIVVSDTSWSVPALGGFPGGYMKDVSAWLTAENWIDLMRPQTDKRMLCMEHVAYFDGNTLKYFVETYEGYFVDSPRGRTDDDESIERGVVLYGNETMAKQLARGEIASAGESLGHWKQFGYWYANSDA